MSNRTRRMNKRGDRKGESNDSPEIPDRRGTSDIPLTQLKTKSSKETTTKEVHEDEL